MRNVSPKWRVLPVLVALLAVAGCSSKSMISGRVVTPSAGQMRAAGDSSLSHTVIFVAGEHHSEAPAPGTRSQIAQTDDGFHPHVLPVPRGSQVDFRNQGEVYHNAFSLSPVKTFDVGSYAPGETRSVTMDHLGIVNVFCELHPESAGFVVVVPDEFHAQPDATGTFVLPKLPGGKYTVKAWHPIFGEISQEVVLRKNKDLELELEFQE